MGSALDAVLQLKANEQAQQKAQSDSILQATQIFQQARQQAASNQLAILQYKAGLAEKGLVQDNSTPSGFKIDSNLLSPAAKLQMTIEGIQAGKNLNDMGVATGNAEYSKKGQAIIQSLIGMNDSQNSVSNQNTQTSTIPNDISNSQVSNIQTSNLNTPSSVNQNNSPQLTVTGQTLNSLGVPTSTTTNNLPAEAQKDVLKDQALRGTKLNELRSVVGFFEKKINDIPVGSGIQGKIQGIKAEIGGKIGANANAAAYDADIQGLRSQVARGLGEVGNLSETEQKAAIRLLPQITDNKETRIKKLENFKEYINTKLSGMAGGIFNNKNNIYQTGQSKNINGINYVRQEDGTWHPQS